MLGAARKRRKLARATITLAFACLAVLLVPAAQAFAGTGTVEIEGVGSGEVVNSNQGQFAPLEVGSPAMACSYTSPGPATGTCTNTLAIDEGGVEGEEFKAVASPGSAFLEWQVIEGINLNAFLGSGGTCKSAAEGISGFEETEGGGYSCFMANESITGGGPNENVKVKAVFAPAVALNVFVSGKGAVSGSGLTCANPEECTGEYAEGAKVTLKEKAEPGYAFAGWLGCKHTTETTCTVTMTEAKEVTAAFVKEGNEGPAGTSGESPTITPLSKGDVHCAEGGFEITFKGNTEYLCNGEKGATGATGANGTSGASGETGPEGKAGPAGKEGPAGKAGANGVAGTQGPAGPAGPPGRDAQVTCSVKQPKKKGKRKAKVSVTCKVTLVAKASSARVHWSLTHGRHLVRHGASRGGRLHLAGLTSGSYELHVQGQKGATAIVVG